MLKKITKRFKKGDVKVEKRSTLREAVEASTEAITFAEAGLGDHARQVMARADAEPKKVLVVSHEDCFSRAVVEYALGFAERMGYEIVAMNVLQIADRPETVAPYCSLIEERFKENAKESVAEFYREAERRGIPFMHMVKVGPLDKCIKEAVGELKRVEFVISEPEAHPEVVHETEKTVIPVYAVSSVA
ncbi:universal stress protein [Thermodesulforhabdus norvegica]|uniref:Universal stress protein n=1 Tax=Thermodesulforhabdus norvegica TaxID=39841 RepID=A0A1I4SL47_9BACT|nr:universal stress protein [Thermodesulforhabdus norvegica]SFM65111.1 hypothetical protein SAMN05660836_01021 [Thermodesulforhabdus norvegica]